MSRKGRQRRQANQEWAKRNYVLQCKHCGWRPSDDLSVGVVAAHFETEHDTDHVQLDLVWIGEGPDPNARGAE